MLRIHETSPADSVEAAYSRILHERMVGLPLLNEALSVAAVDFQRWQGHWLGMVVTPWCMSALLVPGQEAGWESVSDNRRRFVKFPAGDFAFLGSEEPELGEYQSCALFSPMDRFASQLDATIAARAALIALLGLAVQSHPEKPKEPRDQPSLSRRRFLALR